MGFAERKVEPEKHAEPEVQQKSTLLDEAQMFAHKPLPYREVEFVAPDGTEGTVLIQALTMLEMDEINHIQGQPVLDARGNVLEDANQIGWDAKVVARALRRPNKTRIAGEHWLAKAEEIATQWLPGTVKKISRQVLEISGYLQLTRAEQKKDS